MSVQVRRRRESAAFLSTYVGAQGELLVDTTNNRVQVHDGATPGGWPAAKLADVIGRTAVADAAYAALATDRTIAYTALTAARTVTLPASSAYPAGTQLLVVDEAGACAFALAITIACTGSDTIDGAPSAIINTPYGFLALSSNGAGKWTIVDFSGATTAQLTNRNAIVNGSFAINQRGYASGAALAAGAYGHDRFKAGSGGCTCTFAQAVSDTTVTIAAGSLVQVVEGANIPATTLWLTWTGTAMARVYQGSAASQTSPAYAAGSPATIGGAALNVLAVSGLTVGTNTSVEFSSGGVGLVQLEAALPNAGPTRFERRHRGQELALCQRYFEIGRVVFRGYATSGSTFGCSGQFHATKRATPTIMTTNAYNAGFAAGAMNVSATPESFDLSRNATATGAAAYVDDWQASAEL